MATSYGREWLLTIGGYQWSDLRVVFEVKRTLGKYPDPAQITVYNLAATTRASFGQGDQVQLVAGYQGNAGLLYSGQVMDLIINRDGPDWASTFTVRDGDSAWKTKVNTVFASSAPLTVAVNTVANAMGLLVLPTSQALLQGLRVRGQVVHLGPGHDALSKMLAPYKLNWCLQDGQLVITPTNGTTSEEAVLLSPTTGLVGAPVPMTDKKIKGFAQGFRRLRITSLLEPSLTPGRRVVLQSEQYSGVYRVDAVVHRGDSRGQDWYSVIETTFLGAGVA